MQFVKVAMLLAAVNLQAKGVINKGFLNITSRTFNTVFNLHFECQNNAKYQFF